MTRKLGHGTTLVSLQMIGNWEEVSYTWDGCAAIKRSFNRLQKRDGRNLMEFKKKKMQNSCTWQRLTPCTSTGWGQPAGKQLWSKNLGFLMDAEYEAAKKANGLQGCIRKSTPIKSREEVLSLSFTMGQWELSAMLCPALSSSNKRDMDMLEWVEQRAMNMIKGLEHLI